MASDNFNRANGALTAPWFDAAGLGIASVVSNELSAPSDSMYLYQNAALTVDQYSEFASSSSAFGTTGGGPGVRCAPTGTTLYWNDDFASTANGECSKQVSNAYTVLGLTGTSKSYPRRIEVQGSTIRIYYGGVQVANSPWTDTSIPGTAGTSQPGFWIYDNRPLDNWSGGDYTKPTVISTTRVDALAGSGSTSVTVPTDATAVVAFFSHYDAVTGAALATMTLGGVAMTDETDVLKNEQMAVGDAGTNSTGVGVEYLSWLPGTGTQTFAWSWSAGGNQDEGGAIYLIWLKNVNHGTPFRDFALDSEIASTAPSVSIACKSTDLVIGYVQNFSAFGNFTGATVDTLLYTNDLYNSENVNMATLVATNGILTFSNTSPNYSTLVAISIAARRSTTFPEAVTSISDDFNRADGDALGSNWTEIADVDILSNQMYFPGPGHGMAYWTPAKFLEQEIRVQVTAIGSSNIDIQWRAALASNRANDPTTTTNWSGPHLFISASTNTVQLRAWDGTGQEGLHDGMKVPGGIQVNDEFGIRAVSRSFEVYHRHSNEGVWRLLGVRAYEQFYSQGRVMLEGFAAAQSLDNFGVATYPTPTTVGQYVGTGIHSVSGGAGNGVATFDLTVPETISVGDTTFFCVVLEYGQRGTLTWPDGTYTQVGTWVPGPTTDPYGTPAIGVFRKVYAGVTPVHVTAVTGTTRGWNISQVAYKGDVSAIQTATGTDGDSTLPRTGPVLSGTVPGNRLVCFHGGSAVDCRMQWSPPFACRMDGEYYGMNSVADAPAEDYLFPTGKIIDYGAPSSQSMWLLAEVGTVVAPSMDAGPTLID